MGRAEGPEIEQPEDGEARKLVARGGGDEIVDEPYERLCVQHKARQAKVRAAAEFVADLRKMVNNPRLSDIVFRCSDGARVHACRIFLVARSAVFRSMLMNGMAESRLSEIALPVIPSAALLAVLEFLYTGTLAAPESWERALEIYYASRFFLLADLELVVSEVLERLPTAESEMARYEYPTEFTPPCTTWNALEHVTPGLGFVRHSACIGRSYGVFEWDVVIETVCDDFCEIGLYQSTLSHPDGSSLAEQPGGWALRMDETGVFVNRRGRHSIRKGDRGFVSYGIQGGRDFGTGVYGKDYGHKNTRIGVRLDMFERTCSFSVDKKPLGAAWTDLPEGKYYPAATLGSGRRGRARIHLIAGFDVL